MPRILLATGLAGLLCACTSMPDWGWLPGRSGPGLASGERQYDFRWRLSGDRAVAPLQVFDDGRRTWLQFAPGQAVPAIFRGGERGDQPLDYRLAGPYVVLDGVWPRLVLRGGGLRSQVERAMGESPAPAPAQASPAQPPGSESAAAAPIRTSSTRPAVGLPARPPAVPPSLMPASAAGAASALATRQRRADLAAGLAVKPPAPGRAAGGAASADVSSAPRKPAIVATGQAVLTPRDAAYVSSRAPALAAAGGKRAKQAAGPIPVALAGTVAASYEVGPQDGNLRQALSRWARAAGWTFEPEHWAVDADIPITGSARFDSGFKRSVQDLVASTELSEKPLQPCFYSNKVLRIVPYAQACDRSADPARVS